VTEGLPQDEALADRPADILHQYHVNDQLFPTATERSLALAPGQNRLLLESWKPATDMSWAQVAAGGADARIDRLAAYIKSTFPYRFFLTIYHEPEDNVVPTAGSGYTAADYAAMYRHVVLRLRADGATNAITVMNYMGWYRWAQQSWFSQLWPGDDVVDWIGLDPYGSGSATGWPRTFSQMVNGVNGSWSGYYSWATSQHPGKPIMLCEWGASYDASNPTGQATLFNDVAASLSRYPAIKALVYFDMPTPPAGDPYTYPGNSLPAYRALARNPEVVGPDPAVVYGG
jgi:hypothetical protein